LVALSKDEQNLLEVHKIRLEERNIYDNFEKRYRERKFVKSSELLWGSIVKIAFAIGRLYGKKLGQHKLIVLLMKDLAKNDPEVIEWIDSAGALHSNFYHNWMDEEIFESHVRKVIRLRIWLIKMLDEKTAEIMQSLVNKHHS